MKKNIIIIILFIMFSIFVTEEKEMIRIRVLANSNSEYDQNIKSDVVEIVNTEFSKIMTNTTNIKEAREKINNNLEMVSKKINEYLLLNNVNYKYNINFGLNYFPNKELNGKKYEEGYYESVLVTLGNGEGDNWWCILFPSICLTDENMEYDSILKNIFEKIFY